MSNAVGASGLGALHVSAALWSVAALSAEAR